VIKREGNRVRSCEDRVADKDDVYLLLTHRCRFVRSDARGRRARSNYLLRGFVDAERRSSGHRATQRRQVAIRAARNVRSQDRTFSTGTAEVRRSGRSSSTRWPLEAVP
jgi:hypothetical protein